MSMSILADSRGKYCVVLGDRSPLPPKKYQNRDSSSDFGGSDLASFSLIKFTQFYKHWEGSLDFAFMRMCQK